MNSDPLNSHNEPALSTTIDTPDPARAATQAALATTPEKAAAKQAPAKPSGKKDQPYFDPTPYGNGPDDSVDATQADENAAVTHHSVSIGGAKINYTATVGHLVTVDPSSSKPDAKMFYVAFTKDGAKEDTRPLTFFYNGGPGSSSVFVLLGSFAPRRIKTAMPSFTPPAPYQMEDNPDSLLDKSDLIFVNPVGTGYSAAIAPNKNRDFWGVDEDAGSIAQFIKRYLTKNNRWNSPARGWHRPERGDAAIVDFGLPAVGQSGRRAADRIRRCVVSQETRRASDAHQSAELHGGSGGIFAHGLSERAEEIPADRR
jgi:hypothetical protein